MSHRCHGRRMPPNGNGIENLWHWFRGHCCCNHVYRDDDPLFDPAATAWHRLALDPALIQSVCHKPWLTSAANF